MESLEKGDTEAWNSWRRVILRDIGGYSGGWRWKERRSVIVKVGMGEEGLYQGIGGYRKGQRWAGWRRVVSWVGMSLVRLK